MILKGGLDNKISKLSVCKSEFYIIGGEFAITNDNDNILLRTILGSCVSVILYDHKNKIKALNHFLTPRGDLANESYRHGLFSLETMLKEMLNIGCQKESLSAKIAGGAKMFNGDMHDVGLDNVEFARAFCENKKIPIISEHVLGQNARALALGQKFETFIKIVYNSKNDLK